MRDRSAWRKIAWGSIIASALCVIMWCGDIDASEKHIFGWIEDDVYMNKFFGFRISIPDGWYALDYKKRTGYDFLPDRNDKKSGDSIDLSHIDSFSLLTIVDCVLDPATKEPNFDVFPAKYFALSAHRIGHIPQVKTAADFLKLIGSNNEPSANYFRKTIFSDKIYPAKVGENTFHVREFHGKILDWDVKGKYCAIIVRKFALCFEFIYHSDEDENTLSKLLGEVSLK